MIIIMPQLLANQIAAGEVVERPASVIKECIENSFDAGAKRIEVVVENAGSQFISIKDDGCGIPSDELELALCRHATSKIACIEDLEQLETMGFRGEALASIASVASVRLSSRRADEELGWCLKALGGETQEKTPVSMPIGTRIEIEELFFNTPARRRFMRTPRTEMSHIEDMFKRLAMSRPDVHMKLTHHDKMIRNYPAGINELDQHERLQALMGSEWTAHAIPITAESEGISIAGWITRPPYVRSQADWQYLFVNGRSIRDHAFAHAVKRAMSDLLYQDKHPSWVLYLKVDPAHVDVNIHPTKDRVRFSEAAWVNDWVYKTVRSIFRPTMEVAPERSAMDFLNVTQQVNKKPLDGLKASLPNLWEKLLLPSTPPGTGHDMSAVVASSEPDYPKMSLEAQSSIVSSMSPSVNSPVLTSNFSASAHYIQAFCQIKGAYVLGMCNEDIWLIDIHAAHERQVMEQLLIKFKEAGLEKDNFLIPMGLEEGGYANLIAEHQSLLGRYGFDVKMDEGVWKLYAYPRGLLVSQTRKIFMNLLTHLQQDLLVVEAEMLISEIIADIACHSAINVSRTMTRIEMQHFMEQIQHLPSVCNHGRPWKWVIPPSELDRFFMRGR